MKSRIASVIALLAATVAQAGWNAGVSGTVTHVLLYTSSEQILFKLNPMPTTGCTYNDYFELSPQTNSNAESRKNMYAMLLAARHTGVLVSVGYDTGSSCGPSGRPAVFALFTE